MSDYQIFISYRRDGGDILAGRLADRFNALGYKVFFDVESMRSGTFNTQILYAIAQCKDVLLVLPPNALDRCVNEDDWVRQEIAFAIKNKKNIIPIIMRGFEFPQHLPADIDIIRNFEGVTASSEYFDAVINRIESLLNSKKSNITTKPKNTPNNIKLPLFLPTPDSNFASWGQLCLESIQLQHSIYNSEQERMSSISLETYLEDSYSTHCKISQKSPPSLHTRFDKEHYILRYNLYHNFNLEIRKILKKHLKINDDSLLNLFAESANMIRNYISYLYSEQPLCYQTRIAELIWLFFEFDHPSENTYNRFHSVVLNHLFLGANLLDIREIYYGSNDFYSSKRINKYNILNEVSFTVQLIATSITNPDIQNEQLSLFLVTIFFLYMFCECTHKTKQFKKYILINYKYLDKKSINLSKENQDLFSKIIDACDKHIKIKK